MLRRNPSLQSGHLQRRDPSSTRSGPQAEPWWGASLFTMEKAQSHLWSRGIWVWAAQDLSEGKKIFTLPAGSILMVPPKLPNIKAYEPLKWVPGPFQRIKWVFLSVPEVWPHSAYCSSSHRSGWEENTAGGWRLSCRQEEAVRILSHRRNRDKTGEFPKHPCWQKQACSSPNH